MTFELEISTMHKTKEECFAMLAKMNVRCNCIIINQCDCNDYFEKVIDDQHVRIFFTTERGLSRSRNMALRNCNADILGIADDDLYYYDDFDKIIINAYNKQRDAGVMIFNMDYEKKTFPEYDFRCNFFHLLGFISMLCTFNMKVINSLTHKKKLLFNNLFGSGSSYFHSGEENIFLADCYHAGLHIYYRCVKILYRPQMPSSWFSGYDEKFLRDRGAIFYAMSKYWYPVLVLQFALRRKAILKAFSFFERVSLMNSGRKEFIALTQTK